MLKKISVIMSLTIFLACQSQSPTLSIEEVSKEIQSRSKPSNYNEKEITVRGYIYSEARREPFGDVAGFIGLGEKKGLSIITCNFRENDAAEFTKIKGLQYITVKGVFHDLNKDLTPCTLVNVEPQTNYPVQYVERTIALPPSKVSSPSPQTERDRDAIQKIEDPNSNKALELIITSHDDGKLYLNLDEIGELLDEAPLIEKLKTIFQEREENGISKREVIIDPRGKIHPTRINVLIERIIEDAKATSILVIK